MKNEIQIHKNNSIANMKQAAWNSLAEESQKAYQSDFNLFFAFVKKNPKAVTSSDVLSFVEHLRKEGYKNSSINRKIASLSKMFRVMKIAGEISENPVETLKQFKKISMPVNKEIRGALTMQEIKTAIKIKKSASLREKRLVLIIRMLAKTGLRISEMINIKHKDIEDLDRNHKLLRIVGKGRKERFIYLDNDFYNNIMDLFPKNMEYLFYTSRNTPYNRRVLWMYVKEFFREKINKECHPHLLRHTFITHKISVEKQDIKAVSRYAGHQDVSTTLNMYCDTALDVKTSKIKI